MRQTDTCGRVRCGHMLMMHSGGSCTCGRCAAFVPRVSKRLEARVRAGLIKTDGERVLEQEKANKEKE